MPFSFELCKHGSNVALVSGELYITYKNLYDFSQKVGAVINSREVVVLCANNSWESIALYVSFINQRIVVILLNDDIDPDSLNNLVVKFNPKYVFTPKDKKLSFNHHIIEMFFGYKCCQLQYSSVNVDSSLALLMPTSGSTGCSKLVRLSYENLYSNTKAIIAYQALVDSDVAITTLPLAYAYGLSIINTHLLVGGRIVVFNESVLTKNFWIALNKEKVTNFGGVPYTYEMLSRINLDSYLCKCNLRFITQAGGKLSIELIKKYQALCSKNGMKFYVMYGQTEATARISYVPWEKLLNKAGSIGIPIPGGKLELMDINGNIILENDCEGEIRYSGANVMLGYALSKIDLTKGDENNKTLLTGDFAIRDSDGYFYITGRKKRIIKIAGVRISLDDIEEFIWRHGAQCVCKGRDNLLQVYLVNCINSADYFELLTVKLRIPCKCIEVYEIKEIPRLHSGKVDYHKL